MSLLQKVIHNVAMFYAFYFAAIMAFIGLLALAKWAHTIIERRRERREEIRHAEENDHQEDPVMVRLNALREAQENAPAVGLAGDEHGGEAGAVGSPAEHEAHGVAAGAAKVRIADVNEHGEIAGYGPLWACSSFGTAGHNYQECRVCMGKFESWLEIQRGIYMYPGPGWGMPY